MQSALSDEEPGSEYKKSPQDNVERPIAGKKKEPGQLSTSPVWF
jgi:hypothetical protein